MRSINLLKIPAEAELVRLRAWMQRHARRGVYGAVAAVFGLAVLALGEVAGWQALLLLEFEPIPATLILLGVNLLIAVAFALVAARSAPGLTEREALRVRQQALEAARGSLAFTMAVPAATSLLRRGRNNRRRGFGLSFFRR